jgi:hypothetical protein
VRTQIEWDITHILKILGLVPDNAMPAVWVRAMPAALLDGWFSRHDPQLKLFKDGLGSPCSLFHLRAVLGCVRVRRQM